MVNFHYATWCILCIKWNTVCSHITCKANTTGAAGGLLSLQGHTVWSRLEIHFMVSTPLLTGCSVEPSLCTVHNYGYFLSFHSEKSNLWPSFLCLYICAQPSVKLSAQLHAHRMLQKATFGAWISKNRHILARSCQVFGIQRVHSNIPMSVGFSYISYLRISTSWQQALCCLIFSRLHGEYQ